MVSISASLTDVSLTTSTASPITTPSPNTPPTKASFTPLTSLTVATTDAPRDRLAELVHHLSDVPLSDARRAVQHHRPAGPVRDPLSVVAAAMVELRNERPKAVA